MDLTETPGFYEIGSFRVDVGQRLLLDAGGARCPLSSRAFELLLFFVRHPGELHDKNRLMAAVWPNTVVEENNLNQSIGALRKALGDAPGEHKFLVTVPGRGYKFVAPVRAVAREANSSKTDSTDAVVPAAVRPAAPRRHWPYLLALAAVAIGAAVVFRPRATQPVERSIAVLPFENRSADRENEYLALGIQDEILTLLTRVSDLRVVSRTSTLRYARRDVPATQIGREIGIAYLLAGSVQRSGDTVRVNVMLIDAAADRQVWAESYERKATDVFAVESEVARSVAAALRVRLSAEEQRRLAQAPTLNPRAYDYYLQARASAERSTRTEREIREAIADYEAAVRLDPDFASAWAQLSRRHANFFSLGYDRSSKRAAAARRALEEAERLAPDRVETRAARGYYQFVVEADLAGAERTFRELEVKYPTNPDPTAGLAQILADLGQQDRSDDYARRTLALDPLNPYRHAIVCQDYAMAKELEVAAAACDRALELLPGDEGALALRAGIHQSKGELDAARALLRDLEPAPGDWRSLRVLSRQLLLDGDAMGAAELLRTALGNEAELGSRRGVVRRWLGDAYRLAGNAAEATAAYELALTDLSEDFRQQENPLALAEQTIVNARLGRRTVAQETLELCKAIAARGRPRSVIDCTLAEVQVELATGKPADAVARIRDAMALRAVMPPLTPALLRLDPEFKALRERPDFQALP